MSSPCFRPGRRAFVASAAACALADARAAPGYGGAVAYEAPVGEGDVAVLDALLAIERSTLDAYRRIAGCGLVAPAYQDVLARHAADHRAHAELFAATIRTLGGKPSDRRAAPRDDATPASEAEALDLAARVELAGANACLRMLPSLRDRALAKVAARVAADEAMHWTRLNAALRRPLPDAALFFGA